MSSILNQLGKGNHLISIYYIKMACLGKGGGGGGGGEYEVGGGRGGGGGGLKKKNQTNNQAKLHD